MLRLFVPQVSFTREALAANGLFARVCSFGQYHS